MKREELLKKAYENTKSVVPPRNEVENENVIAEIEGGEDRRIQEAQLGLFKRLNDDKREIKLLHPKYISLVTEEFTKLMKVEGLIT